MRGYKKFSDEISLEDGGLDAGLMLLSAITPEGVERAHAEIAFVCGCNHQDIWHIENRAKKKLKAEFKKRGIDFDFFNI
jgi:hypothetical protein